MRNDILASAIIHRGFTEEEIHTAITQISLETGFEGTQELQRRFIYERDKTWRIRIGGLFNKDPAVLRIENIKLPIEEESIRAAFREQSHQNHGLVRPPDTHVHAPFEEKRGYGWSIDEDVPGRVLFLPEEDPVRASEVFCTFYQELRRAVPHAFWPGEPKDGQAFPSEQLLKWENLSEQKFPGQIKRFADILIDLKARLLGARVNAFRFQHAHLAGPDVRLGFNDEYVVFANHFWDWRQEAYDVAFPIWGQWLALPDDRRTAEKVAHITETWLERVRSQLGKLIREEDLRLMLLNRIYGSLLLDLPAQHEFRSSESICALERALVEEARRLLQ